jgi:hypothetical protein
MRSFKAFFGVLYKYATQHSPAAHAAIAAVSDMRPMSPRFQVVD